MQKNQTCCYEERRAAGLIVLHASRLRTREHVLALHIRVAAR